jgi:hypothetical protein
VDANYHIPIVEVVMNNVSDAAQVGALMVVVAFLLAMLLLLTFVLLDKMLHHVFGRPKQKISKETMAFNQLSAEDQAKTLVYLIMHENDD